MSVCIFVATELLVSVSDDAGSLVINFVLPVFLGILATLRLPSCSSYSSSSLSSSSDGLGHFNHSGRVTIPRFTSFLICGSAFSFLKITTSLTAWSMLFGSLIYSTWKRILSSFNPSFTPCRLLGFPLVSVFCWKTELEMFPPHEICCQVQR